MRAYWTGMKLICVIGDIVESRKIVQRRQIQSDLNRVLRKLSSSKKLLSPYTITLGDEFQAVYEDADGLFSDFLLIHYAIFPVRVRFSVGVGKLTTPVNHKTAIGMDGPAFHVARDGVKDLRRSGSLLRIGFAEKSSDSWINPTLDLISHVSTNWKRSRFLVLQRLLQGDDAKVIARKANLAKSAVYKNIKAGALNTITALFSEVRSSVNIHIRDK